PRMIPVRDSSIDETAAGLRAAMVGLSEDFPVTTSNGAFAYGNGPLALGVTPLRGHSRTEWTT
ncbi:hypothetical protein, partial [Frankia sp. CiP3]|uniref:hypothetical protein n=1 Tax=Frankia sp. CiP3 TaxID=2880971 RepID=UPI001EF684FE